MAEFYAGGIVYEIRVDDKSGIGIEKAEQNLKDFERETKKTDTNLKSLSRDTSVLSRSLVSLGGSAVVAGNAIGGDLGKSISDTGMAAFGLGALAHTAKDGLTLLGLSGGTAATSLAALGGPAVIAGLGLAVVGIVKIDDAIYLAEKRSQHLPKSFQALTIDINKADDALKSYMDHLNEIKGIPKEIGELEIEKTGAAFDFMQAGMDLEELLKRPDATPLDIARGKYYKDTQERRLISIMDEIEALKKRPAEIAQTLWKEEAAARGIPTGVISAAPPGYMGVTQGEPREGPVGWLTDLVLGRQPGPREWIHPNATDPYGVPTNFLYNRNIPAAPTITINQTVTVASASDVKTVLEDGLSLADKVRAQGY